MSASSRATPCIFSSRIIPGNEHAIGELHNALIRRGVEIVTESDHFVHVSGHPGPRRAGGDVSLGEARHRRSGAWRAAPSARPCARWPRAARCASRVLVENGSILRLAPGQPEVIGQVASGRLGLDGTRSPPWAAPALKMRQRMAHNGTAVATIILDRSGRLQGEPLLTLHGLGCEPEDEEAAKLEAAAAARKPWRRLPRASAATTLP